jgi:hypothetical protein
MCMVSSLCSVFAGQSVYARCASQRIHAHVSMAEQVQEQRYTLDWSCLPALEPRRCTTRSAENLSCSTTPLEAERGCSIGAQGHRCIENEIPSLEVLEAL